MLGGLRFGVAKIKKLFLDGTEVTASTAEINKLDGTGDVLASGTQAAVIADIANDATGEQIATAVNSINAALQAFGITASE